MHVEDNTHSSIVETPARRAWIEQPDTFTLLTVAGPAVARMHARLPRDARRWPVRLKVGAEPELRPLTFTVTD